MQFFRQLKPIKALSFDLDDTLYSNHPVMLATYQKMLGFFAEHLPMPAPTQSGQYDHSYWFNFRNQAIALQPELKHDVTELRRISYRLGLIELGLDQQQALTLADLALDYFSTERSNFSVPDDIHQFLSQISTRYPIVAISNGNVDTKAIGIDHYFTHIYHANYQDRQKPASDMFKRACNDLAIAPEQLLHVGDCGNADIKGALAFGCQAAWVSKFNVGKPIKILPTLAVTNVKALTAFS